MRWRLEILAFIVICFLGNVRGQSPYHIDWNKELYFLGAGAGTLGLGAYLETQTPTYTLGQLETFKARAINRFDRGAISNYSMSAHQTSDWLLYGSLALPTLLLANQTSRADFGTIAALWGETLLLNTGITALSKYTFRRPRPYVLNPDILAEKKMTTAAQASFISGHTSMTAATTFFSAKIFSDYYPDSKWKPVVWIAAAAIPALTGYMRVKAGKHYPTDVMAGYAVGAAIGYLVPHLHKRKQNEKGWNVHGGTGGVLLRYKF